MKWVHAGPLIWLLAAALAAQPRFVDVTRQAGITFRHNAAKAGKKLLPETMGSDHGDYSLLTTTGSTPMKGTKEDIAGLVFETILQTMKGSPPPGHGTIKGFSSRRKNK